MPAPAPSGPGTGPPPKTAFSDVPRSVHSVLESSTWKATASSRPSSSVMPAGLNQIVELSCATAAAPA